MQYVLLQIVILYVTSVELEFSDRNVRLNDMQQCIFLVE